MSRIYNLSDENIAVLHDGAIKMVPASHPNYVAVRDVLLNGTAITDEDFGYLIDPKKFIVKLTLGGVQIGDNDDVLYKGRRVPEYLATRLVATYKAGEDVQGLINFANKSMDNPNSEIVEDLFRWLENANMPLCPDGDFLAYRKVRDNWMDVHSGTVKYTPGEITHIDPEKCTFDRSVDCGPGLHFADRHYGFSGERHLLVKIDPRWVTSIPDGDRTKGRCHTMFVVKEVTPQEREEDLLREGTLATLIGHDGRPVRWNYAQQADPIDWDREPQATLNAPALQVTGPSQDDRAPAPPKGTAQRHADAVRKAGKVVNPGVFTHAGRNYKAQAIKDGIAKHGQRGFSAQTGVPRTTLQGWVKQING